MKYADLRVGQVVEVIEPMGDRPSVVVVLGFERWAYGSKNASAVAQGFIVLRARSLTLLDSVVYDGVGITVNLNDMTLLANYEENTENGSLSDSPAVS